MILSHSGLDARKETGSGADGGMKTVFLEGEVVVTITV